MFNASLNVKKKICTPGAQKGVRVESSLTNSTSPIFSQLLINSNDVTVAKVFLLLMPINRLNTLSVTLGLLIRRGVCGYPIGGSTPSRMKEG